MSGTWSWTKQIGCWTWVSSLRNVFSQDATFEPAVTGALTLGCGSAFISSGSGSRSSNLGWIPIRIWIQSGSRALMTKNWKKITAEKKKILGSKTTIYLSLGLYKERQSYGRSLQLSKEAIQHQNMNFKKNSTFEGHFCPPGSKSNPDTDPDPQPCFKVPCTVPMDTCVLFFHLIVFWYFKRM